MNKWSALGVFGLMLAVAAPAQAISISGSSSGSFNDIDNCGFFESCSVGGTTLTYAGGSFQAQAVTINTATPGDNVDIARLTWTNGTGLGTFDFDWRTSFVFTNPGGTTAQEFDMALTTPIIGTDNVAIQLADLTSLGNLLANLLPGVQIADVKFRVTGGLLSGTTWSNPEGTANLYITADFRDTSTSAPTPAPEPASMLLLGSGLAGIAAARRRRMMKQLRSV